MKSAIKGCRAIPTFFFFFFSNFGRTCPSLTPDDQLLFPQGAGLCVTSGSIDFTLHQMLTARSFLDGDLCWKSDHFHLSCFTVQAEDIKWRWQIPVTCWLAGPEGYFISGSRPCIWECCLPVYAHTERYWLEKYPPPHPRLRLISQGNRHTGARAHYSGT